MEKFKDRGRFDGPFKNPCKIKTNHEMHKKWLAKRFIRP